MSLLSNARHRYTIGCVVATTCIVATLGAVVTDPSSTWYRSLSYPSWGPAQWAYGIVWPILYVLIMIAASRALIAAKGQYRLRLEWGFGVNAALNLLWSMVFFGLHSVAGGVIICAALTVSTMVVMIQLQERKDTLSLLLLVPYVLWTTFATLLNFFLLLGA